MLKAVAETGTPVVLVLLNGSAIAINWANEHIPAIIEAWYPGQSGGRAVAEVLFGDTNPGGRLPVTFYKSVEQLPPFEAYDMDGRTYRYFDGEVLYPFGYGLSFTTFQTFDLSLSHDHLSGPDIVHVNCRVRNTGQVAGDEVVQIYLRDEAASFPIPRHSLVGFRRVRLAPGSETSLKFEIQPEQLACMDDNGRWLVEPGDFIVFAGGGQPGTPGVQSARLTVTGGGFTLD